MFAAVGTALAEDALTRVWVSVKFQGQSTFQCVQMSFSCESTGGVPCEVAIPDLGRNTRGRVSGCTTNLNSSVALAGTYDPTNIIIDAAPE